jgi:hypothetical protein
MDIMEEKYIRKRLSDYFHMEDPLKAFKEENLPQVLMEYVDRVYDLIPPREEGMLHKNRDYEELVRNRKRYYPGAIDFVTDWGQLVGAVEVSLRYDKDRTAVKFSKSEAAAAEDITRRLK